MDATFTVTGLSDLEEALNGLKTSTGKNVLRRVLVKAGEPIERAAEEKVRVKTGHLKRGIKVSTKVARSTRKVSPVEAYVGPDQDPAGIANEFGNRHQAPQPFMRPAFEEKVGESLDVITTSLGEEIDKAATRAARKAARTLGG